MVRWLTLAVAVAFFLSLPQSSPAATGKELFEKMKCHGCHSMKAEKIEKQVSKKTGKVKKGPDLSGAGIDHNAAWITKWLQKEEKKESKYAKGKEVKHKKKFKGTDQELKDLAAWLETKKTKVELTPEEEGAGGEDEEDEKDE